MGYNLRAASTGFMETSGTLIAAGGDHARAGGASIVAAIVKLGGAYYKGDSKGRISSWVSLHYLECTASNSIRAMFTQAPGTTDDRLPPMVFVDSVYAVYYDDQLWWWFIVHQFLVSNSLYSAVYLIHLSTTLGGVLDIYLEVR